MVRVPVIRLPHGADLPVPTYQTPGAAGMDLMAACGIDEKITLNPLERGLVETGLVLQIPDGYEGQVRPRSGLAVRNGITVLNAPGTIDADYRGEVKVALVNLGSEPFTVTRGMRIAQLVIAPVSRAILEETGGLSQTLRGAGGFGSTGVRTDEGA
jgi:dUTP pyrophosphatase